MQRPALQQLLMTVLILAMSMVTVMSTVAMLFSAQVDAQLESQADTTPGQVLIINQVRGRECCDQGRLAHLERQLEAVGRLRLPAVFVLRWDALGDEEMVRLLRQAQLESRRQPTGQIELGAMVEITPGLAAAAGVAYTGTPENWFEAQHAFTIGYQPAERRRLVDTLMARFAEVFGENPRVTAGWMIDTPILNYLHDQYGVQLHQITREQWGTDSYTLIGGPPHYPYPPSSDWLFVPDFGQQRRLLIARQTVTDPLLNYGDTSSSFTSQPNDYALGGRDIEYFRRLLDQAIDQPGRQVYANPLDQPAQPGPLNPPNLPGFALIGLENSMADQFQAEFVRQLELVARRRDQGRAVLPSLDQLHQTWQAPSVRLYASRPDSSSEPQHQGQSAWWITTERYRVRLRSDGQRLAITDLRVFDPRYPDPYASQAAVNKGYWIVPYLVDGSRYYRRSLPEPGLLTKWFGPPVIPQLTPQPQPDLDLPTTGRIELPPLQSAASLRIKPARDRVVFGYVSQDKQVSLSFGSDSFRLETASVEGDGPPAAGAPLGTGDQFETDLREPALPEVELFYPPQHPVVVRRQDDGSSGSSTTANSMVVQWQLPDLSLSHSLVMECGRQTCGSKFTTSHQALPAARQQQYPFIFPEQRPRPLSADDTILYVHNSYAVAGRNPIRLVVVPYDTHGFFTSLAEPPRLTTRPAVAVSTDPDSNRLDQIQLFDLAHPRPLATTVDIQVAPGVTKQQRVFFAPNCKQQWWHCATHPQQAWWYLRAIVGDKFRTIVLEEVQ